MCEEWTSQLEIDPFSNTALLYFIALIMFYQVLSIFSFIVFFLFVCFLGHTKLQSGFKKW